MFVAFEGAESVGKTTMVKRLQDNLKGYDLYTTREPGSKEIDSCVSMREILLESEHLRDDTETFLFLADRSEHYHEEIQPKLENNDIVLTDRYALSTAIYQFGHEFINNKKSRKLFLDMHEFANIEFPDLTIVFHAPYEVTRERMDEDKLDRIESKGKTYLKNITKYFSYSFDHIYPGDTVKVDATKSKDEVYSVIEELIANKYHEMKYYEQMGKLKI